MNKKLTKNTDAIVSTTNKAQVKSYLHAACEMEHDIYTLEQSIEDLNQTVELLEVKPKILTDDYYYDYDADSCYDFDSDIPSNKKYVGMIYEKPCITKNGIDSDIIIIDLPKEPSYEEEREYVLTQINPKWEMYFNRNDYEPTMNGCAMFLLWVLGIIGLGFSVVVFFDALAEGEIFMLYGLLLAATSICIPFGIYAFWKKNKIDSIYNQKLAEHNKNYAKYKASVEQKNEETIKRYNETNEKIRLDNSLKKAQYQKEMAEYEKKADEIKRDYEDNLARAEIFKQQIAEMKKSLEKMYKQRDTFYAVDTVPRDFRTMDAVFMLASYYDNRLVDSLREAILMYKEDTFKKHVLVGMQNIAKNINALQSTMSSVCSAIHTTNLKISDMNRNLYGISDNIIQNNRQTELLGERTKLLYEETKLGRYANEAMARNARLISEHCSELNDRHKSDSERLNKLLDELDD